MLLSLGRLNYLLHQVTLHERITGVDLYGGEVALLPEKYLTDLFYVVEQHFDGKINIITNLSALNNALYDDRVDVAVSYNFECREKHELVFRNIMMFPKPVHVLMLASECLIKKDVDEMIIMFNGVANITSVEIKPYSTNQANQQRVTFKEYEEFVKKWLTSSLEKNFLFVNELQIQDSVALKRNAFSDDHIYITPTGKFAVLEFDAQDNEFFLELNSYGQYLKWTVEEQQRVLKNKFCSQCEYFGGCLSEHLREVKSLENSCNGFKHLLQWYEHERIQD